MGSSLPRHGVGVRTKTQEKEQKQQKTKTKGRVQVSIIYMMHEQINVMMHALM